MASFLGGIDTLRGNAALPDTGVQDDSIHDYFHQGIGESVAKEITLSADGATASVNIFQLTGSVEIISAIGFVTDATTLVNCTGASLQLYDGTNTVQLTKNDGVLSGYGVGTMITKNAAATVTMAVADNSQCRLTEPSGIAAFAFYPFFVTQKLSTATYVRFTYTTTDSPISAKILWNIRYRPETLTTSGTNGTLVAV